jgi:hypothetical protein
MAKTGQKPEEMIELQTTVRALEVEVLGRYVAQPKHLDRIRVALAETFDRLVELGKEEGVAALGCPPGYIHRVMCECIPFAACIDGEEKPGLRRAEIEKAAKRVRGGGRPATARTRKPRG